MLKLSITWLAAAAVLAATGVAQAQVTYTFQSPALDNTSFTVAFSVPTAFADGSWSLIGATAPAGFSYSATDGYTTDTTLGDLQGLHFNIVGGVIAAGDMTVVDSASPFDPYYGYTYFYANSAGGTELQDAANPGITGIDYSGHHIPVANGGPGLWTQTASVPGVPEPATGALTALGLGFLGFATRRRSFVSAAGA